MPVEPSGSLIRATTIPPDAACYICLDGFSGNDAFIHTGGGGANHPFHALCIDEWINGSAIVIDRSSREEIRNAKSTCPGCRYEITHKTDGTTLKVTRAVAHATNELRNPFANANNAFAVGTGEEAFTTFIFAGVMGFTGTPNRGNETTGQFNETEDIYDDAQVTEAVLIDEISSLFADTTLQVNFADNTNNLPNSLDAVLSNGVPFASHEEFHNAVRRDVQARSDALFGPRETHRSDHRGNTQNQPNNASQGLLGPNDLDE